MKKILLGTLTLALAVSCNKGGKKVDKLETEDQKAAYSIGVSLGRNVSGMQGNLVVEDSIDYDTYEKGLRDYFSGDNKRESYALGHVSGQMIESVLKGQKLEGKFDKDYVIRGLMDNVRKNKNLLFNQDSIDVFLNEYMQKHAANLASETLEKSQQFIEDKKKVKDIKETPSGLLYKVEKEGTGEKPAANSVVQVKYTGKNASGKVFDSTEKHGTEFDEIPLGSVIKGWAEGIQLMSVGSKYVFYIKPELGYGEGGAGRDIGPNEALEFEVELIGIKEENTPAPQGAQSGQQMDLTPEQQAELERQIQALQNAQGN